MKQQSAFIPLMAKIPTPHPLTKQLADATKYTVSTAVALALLYNHDARTVLYATGAVASSLSSKVLKRLIRQPRPTDSKSDPGMPSSHATSLAFLALAAWGGRTGLQGVLGIFGVFAAIMGSVARVRVGYHSWQQVTAGWFLGTLNAGVWLANLGRFVQPVQRFMDGFGDGTIMAILAVASVAFAGPDIAEHLRKRPITPNETSHT